ncbi:hypothetical protein G7Y89_g2419 [Cudoniella acicularis]|uniref:Ubiquitin-like domain-containing protein n=1 Tax=Cudoniella acicularis TaxID=354080 RepID=A0A8H4RTE9_9HELO|nr:hypothetical protein G7Y89_g2419 [Cudoniella acicularis]
MSDNGSPDRSSPPVKDKPETLSIKVKDQNNQEMTFKIKYTTKLEKVMAAYCKAQEIDIGTRRFLFEGHRIQKDDTPQSLEMEDDDMIDVFVEQQGGTQ